MLIDSNVIIYAAKPENARLRHLIAVHAPAVSAISYVEVLGYHRFTESERDKLEAFFAAATISPLSESVLNQSVELRQRARMSLGDALVAGTALVYQRELVLTIHGTSSSYPA